LFDAFVPLQAMRQISPLKNKVWIYLFAFAATIKKRTSRPSVVIILTA
jgi:hypothetical protein